MIPTPAAVNVLPPLTAAMEGATYHIATFAYLQKQFWRDAQRKFRVPRPGRGDKRPSKCTTRRGIEQRGFHFQEATGLHEASERRNDTAAHNESSACGIVDKQINVALTIPQFLRTSHKQTMRNQYTRIRPRKGR